MVSFVNEQNQSIMLSTQNYEFSDLYNIDDEYDANWLQVNIEVIDNQQKWKNTDSFLLSSDWLAIAQWFSDVAQFKPLKWDSLGFVEPNIVFKLVKYNISNGTIDFNIELFLECVPSFCRNKSDAKYSFCFTQKDCEKISEMCKEEYTKFPERKYNG